MDVVRRWKVRGIASRLNQYPRDHGLGVVALFPSARRFCHVVLDGCLVKDLAEFSEIWLVVV